MTTILFKLFMSFLTYSIFTNAFIILVKFDSSNPISRAIVTSCGLSWLGTWIFGLIYMFVLIWF